MADEETGTQPGEEAVTKPETEAATGAEVETKPEAGAETETKEVATSEAETKAAEPQPAKKETPWYQKRIYEEAEGRRQAEARAQTLAEENKALKTKPDAAAEEGEGEVKVSPEVIDKIATEKAKVIAAHDRAAEAFDNACNDAFAKGVENHGTEFAKALETCGAIGILDVRDPTVLQDILATDAPHDVLFQLGQNPDLAVKLAKLPQARRIAEFVKMSIKAPAKPAVSKAAAPITPLGGSPKKDFDPLDPSLSDEDWHARQDEIEKAQRAVAR